MVRSSLVRGVGTSLLVPRIILEGEMRVKMKGDHGDFPQLGKCMLGRISSMSSSPGRLPTVMAERNFPVSPPPNKIFLLTVALVFRSHPSFFQKGGTFVTYKKI